MRRDPPRRPHQSFTSIVGAAAKKARRLPETLLPEEEPDWKLEDPRELEKEEPEEKYDAELLEEPEKYEEEPDQ